ncbi:oxidoreductase [Mesorhizobium sp. B2-2-1]|nr:oxidoreductase [Mesorhizobium sp. B2-2-1]
MLATHAAYLANGKNQAHTAKALGVSRETVQRHVRQAAERGLLGTEPVLDGWRLTQTTAVTNQDGDVVREFIQQRPERGPDYVPTDGLALKGKTTWVDVAPGGERLVTREVHMERADAKAQLAALEAMVGAFADALPRVEPAQAPEETLADLLNQFTVTDSHFGMLAHREETGDDYDLKIAERLLLDWFTAAVDCAPPAHTAVLAQLGDLMHHDSLESVTPAHKHVLDADSRLHKVVRVVIRTLRRVIDMLLRKHQQVHVVMASGNHDPASSVWIRELLATVYENEPRITVDRSPMLYYSYEWGKTGLYYHHMHKRGVNDLDRVFAGLFREMFGRCEFNYGHGGHLHSDAVVETQLMRIERHATLAAKDAYAASGGWLSGRSAKVITYSKNHGEVARLTLTPGMVGGWRTAANDNESKEMAYGAA